MSGRALISRLAGLPDFIHRADTMRLEWGVFDCCLWLADWGLELTGIDGAAQWRGTYSTKAGCAKVLMRHGSVLGVVETGALAIGMAPSGERPSRGAVGVVTIDTEDVGAICLGRAWAIITDHGVRGIKAFPVAAWEIP